MLNTTGATVFMVAGTCYHAGEIGEEQVSSRTRKMVYVRLWGIGSLAGTIVRVMQSSIKVIAGSEQSTTKAKRQWRQLRGQHWPKPLPRSLDWNEVP